MNREVLLGLKENAREKLHRKLNCEQFILNTVHNVLQMLI
jgi:hypothetical protein